MANRGGGYVAQNPHKDAKTKHRAMGQIGFMSKAAIAEEAGVSVRTIRRWEIKYNNTYDVERLQNPGSGRPRITTPFQDDALVGYIRECGFDAVKDAVDDTDFPGNKYYIIIILYIRLTFVLANTLKLLKATRI